MIPATTDRLPYGLLWIGFDEQGMSRAVSLYRDGRAFCEAGGHKALLCRAPGGGSLLNRPKSDFTIEDHQP